MREPELLELQKQCHDLFDPIWVNRIVSRQNAYKLLAAAMDVELKHAHIKFFGTHQCNDLLHCLKEAYAKLQ